MPTTQSHRVRPTNPSRRTRATVLGAGAVAALLMLAGCKAAADGTAVPNVVGMHGDKAKDALQQKDAYVAKNVDFKDVHPGESHTRSVLMPSHWKVCSQQPAAGEASVKDMTVTLSVVKNEEDCPATASPTPAVSAAEAATPTAEAPTPTPTPTPTPEATTPAAAPVAPAAPATHEPAPAYTPPAPQPTPAQHQAAGCTTDSKGACIVRGRFCPNSAHGGTGTDAAGHVLTCEDKNGWRWE